MFLHSISEKLIRLAARAWERWEPQCVSLDELDGNFTSNYVYANQFANGKRVLDAGCGYGYGSAILSGGAEYVIGIDLSKKAIESAKNRYDRSNVDFIIADCTNLPFRANSFDTIVSFEVVEHLAKWDKFLEETSRGLKYKGLLVLSTPNKNLQFPHPFHMHEFAPVELERSLRFYFRDVKIMGKRPVNPEHHVALQNLQKSLRMKMALSLSNNNFGRLILITFYFFPIKIRKILSSSKSIQILKAYEFEFLPRDVEKADTLVAIATNQNGARNKMCTFTRQPNFYQARSAENAEMRR